jgi:hypothetical protein
VREDVAAIVEQLSDARRLFLGAMNSTSSRQGAITVMSVPASAIREVRKDEVLSAREMARA